MTLIVSLNMYGPREICTYLNQHGRMKIDNLQIHSQLIEEHLPEILNKLQP